MRVASWLRLDQVWTKLLHGSRKLPRRPKPRPSLEVLEDRVALTAYTVDTRSDSIDVFNATTNSGSLRAVIDDLNTAKNIGVKSSIDFAIANRSVVIAPISSLPSINNRVTIDGTAQAPNPLQKIAILGGSAGAGANGLTFTAAAKGSTLKYLEVSYFSGSGVSIARSNDNVIDHDVFTGNGTGVSIVEPANARQPNNNAVTNCTISENTSAGIAILAGFKNNIAGNTVTSNGGDGIALTDSGNNDITANDVGVIYTLFGGCLVAGNGGDGISLSNPDSYGNNIDGNVISANGKSGIRVDAVTGHQQAAQANVISGNYIGTDWMGDSLTDDNMSPTGNGRAGITVFSSENTYIGSGNVIGGNGTQGVWITAVPNLQKTQNTVFNNFIGVAKDGTTALLNAGGGPAKATLEVNGDVTITNNVIWYPNGTTGVRENGAVGPTLKQIGNKDKAIGPAQGPKKAAWIIENSTGVALGGPNGGDGNIIDGEVAVINSTEIAIQSNQIGSAGNTLDGINIDPSSDSVTITGNTLSDNAGAGVNSAGTNVVITSNTIDATNGTGVLVTAGTASISLNALDSAVLTGGTLTVAGNSTVHTLGVTGGLLVDNATFNVNSPFTQAGGTVQINPATMTVNGSYTESSGSTLTLNDNSAVLVATLMIQHGATTQGFGTITGNVTDEGTLNPTGALAINGYLTHNYSSLNLAAGTSLSVSGAYTLTNGSTNLAAGSTFAVGGNVAMTNGSLSIDAATFSDGGTFTENSGTISLNSGSAVLAATLTIQSGATTQGFGTITGNVTDSGTFRPTGVLNVSGSFTQHASSVNVASGTTLNVAGDYVFDTYGSSVMLTAGGLVTVGGNMALPTYDSLYLAGATLTVAGTLTDSGGIHLTGNGALLAAALLQITSGGMLEGSGTLQGNVTNAGSLTSTYALHVTGNYVQTQTGTLNISIGAGGIPTTLNIDGTASVSGTLNVTFVDNYNPYAGAHYGNILTYASITGGFGINPTDPGPALAWNPTYGSTEFSLDVVNQ